MDNSADRLQQWFFFTASVATVALVMFEVNVSLQWQIILLTALVILLGLPHGALDPIVARRYGLWKTGSDLFHFILIYLLVAAITFGLWVWLSNLTFALFLLLSAWHFSNDWRFKLSQLNRIGMGLALIVIPSLFHSTEVLNIYGLLISTEGARQLVIISSQLWPMVAVLLLTSLWQSLKVDIYSAVEIVLIIITAILLPPLIFFVLYFCLQHSPRHLLAIAKREKLEAVISTAIVFSVLTVILGFMAFLLMPEQDWHQDLLRTVFIGLMILTVPHMILIELTQRLNPVEITS